MSYSRSVVKVQCRTAQGSTACQECGKGQEVILNRIPETHLSIPAGAFLIERLSFGRSRFRTSPVSRTKAVTT